MTVRTSKSNVPSLATARCITLALIVAWAGICRGAGVNHSADVFLTPVMLNSSDTLHFTMTNGQVRRVTVLNSGVNVFTDFGQRQWSIWADLEIDGQTMRLTYEPFSMKALYEPTVVNGMRIGLDGVDTLASAIGIPTSDGPSTVTPSKDVRLWVNDASFPLLPNASPWFKLYQDRTQSHPPTYSVQTTWPVNDDYRVRQDRDVHPTTTELTYARSTYDYTCKTGYLGGWDYGFHVGLDIQMPINTPLYAVTDDAEQRGISGATYNSSSYIVDRTNGDRWRFRNLHVSSIVGTVGTLYDAGTLMANSGDQGAGIPHTHTLFSDRPLDSSSIPLNPWIAMWQGLENRKEADGVIRAAIAPPTGGAAGEAITFSSTGSHPGWTGASQLVSYFWVFSDGTTSTSASLSKAFSQPGMQQAILIVDDGRLKDLDEVFFTIAGTEAASPVITMDIYASTSSQPNPLLPHVGTTVTYSLKAESAAGHPLDYNWIFSDGGTAQGQTATHAVLTPGRHYAIATVTDTVTGRSAMDWYVLDTWEWPAAVPKPFLQVMNGSVTIHWYSVPGKTYAVYKSTHLTEGFSILEDNITATPPINSFHDTSAEGSQAFYSIQVQ
jgi:hypothetical protein